MIKIITACNDSAQYRELADICEFTIRKYCRKHRLSYAFHRITESERPPAWYKILCIQKELENRKTRYCLWMDSDALIYNPDFDLRSIIKPGKQLYLSEDSKGINAGVMMWKNTRQNKRLLKRIWNCKRFINHPWWEQMALIHLVRMDFQGVRERIEYIPQNLFNAYDYSLYQNEYLAGQMNKDSFILHFPGLEHEIRKPQMEKYFHEVWKPTAYQLAFARIMRHFNR